MEKCFDHGPNRCTKIVHLKGTSLTLARGERNAPDHMVYVEAKDLDLRLLVEDNFVICSVKRKYIKKIFLFFQVFTAGLVMSSNSLEN